VETAAGRALALALAEAGADVAAVAARDDAESALAAKRVSGQVARLGRRSPAQAIDAALATAVQVMTRQVAKELGGLDILVACLDQPQASPSERLSEPEWARLVGLNLSALFFACRSAAREMARQGGGAILAVLPQAGQGAAYAALKAAALELVRGLAQEYGGQGVRLNALAFAGRDLPAEGQAMALELLRGQATGQVVHLSLSWPPVSQPPPPPI
jgi:NAD(P)-dependent dehydrogenase (short-subunit alcohol dehydrogenase family)